MEVRLADQFDPRILHRVQQRLAEAGLAAAVGQLDDRRSDDLAAHSYGDDQRIKTFWRDG